MLRGRDSLAKTQLRRYTLDMSAASAGGGGGGGELQQCGEPTILFENGASFELPTINPALRRRPEYQYCYAGE